MVGGCVCVCAQTCISKGAACFSSWHCSQLLGFQLYKNGNDGVFQLLQHHKSQGTSLYKQHCCHSVAWQITTFTCKPAGEPVPSGTPRLQEHHHRAGSCSSTWSFSHQTPPHRQGRAMGSLGYAMEGQEELFSVCFICSGLCFWMTCAAWMSKEGLQRPDEELICGKGHRDTENNIGYITSYHECLNHTMGCLTSPKLPGSSETNWKKVGN